MPGTAALALDDDGRLTPESARAFRAMLRRRDPSLALLRASPEALLGEFDALAPATRTAIVRQVSADTAARLRWARLGAWHEAVVRGLWNWRSRSAGRARMERALNQIAHAVWFGPRWLGVRLLHARCRMQARWSRRPPLAAALIAAGFTPQVLTSWARGLVSDPRVRTYWRDPSSGATSGYMLGLDLLPTDDGWFCLEANLNAALHLERTLMYPVDPVGEGIFAFAKRGGFRCVTMLNVEANRFNVPLLAQFDAHGARLALRWLGYEDPRLPMLDGPAARRGDLRHGFFVPGPDAGTLVLSLRYYGVGTDYLVHDKVAVARGLAAYLRATGDPAFRVEPLTVEPAVGAVTADQPWPNVVYKQLDRDQGVGVHFLKVRTAEEARAVAADIDARSRRAPGVFQRYLVPRRRLDDRPYHIRAIVLCTPAGVDVLGAWLYEGLHVRHDALPWGLVPAGAHFATNFILGGSVIKPLTADEDAEVRGVAQAVTRGIAWSLERSFVVAPGN